MSARDHGTNRLRHQALAPIVRMQLVADLAAPPFLSKLLNRIAPASVFEPLVSIIQAHPLPEPWALDIQRTKRSTCIVDGASGQFENRVTSGTDNSARNAGTSFGVAPRNISRLVDNTGNFRLAVGGMVSSC
jgi:hypothetical protein